MDRHGAAFCNCDFDVNKVLLCEKKSRSVARWWKSLDGQMMAVLCYVQCRERARTSRLERAALTKATM